MNPNVNPEDKGDHVIPDKSIRKEQQKDRSDLDSVIRERSGVYHNDYSPRYKAAYNIYDKAREHMKKIKKETK